MAFLKCAKRLFYLLNFVIVVCGLATLGIGIWIYIDAENFTKIAGVQGLHLKTVHICGQILMACGAAVALFSFIGMGGAKHNSICLLSLYLFLLVSCMGVILSTMVLGVLLRLEVEERLETTFQLRLQDTYSGPRGKDMFTDLFNTFMMDMKCCGLTNSNTSEDFVYDVQAWNRTQTDGHVHRVPSQCCKPSYHCETQPDDDNSYTQGCFMVVKEMLFKYHTVIIATSCGLFGVQFLLILLDLYVIRHRRKK